MNSRRKILAVLLLVVMAVSLLSVCALAADDGDDVAKSITCTTCNGTGVSQGEECGVCEGTGEITSTSRMAFSFWALVPPIVAIILALITKEVYSSLFVGILLGALFYSNFNPLTGLDAIINDGMVPAVADNAGIMLFLVILGVVVHLLRGSSNQSVHDLLLLLVHGVDNILDGLLVLGLLFTLGLIAILRFVPVFARVGLVIRLLLGIGLVDQI